MTWNDNGELSGSDRQALIEALQRHEVDRIGDELLRLDQGNSDRAS